MKKDNYKTLYLCYFGLREPLVQTQVLPYLREIKKGGVDVSILTFETDPKARWTAEQIETEKRKLADEGIKWDFLTYHKRPSAPATLFDVLCGAFFAWRKIRRENIDVVHARAHIPLAMALPVKFLTKVKVIFDIRGLMAEEYIDGGVWKPDSLPVRIIKWIERKGLEKADQIVVLTNRMKNYLVENNLREADTIEVVPCCVDFSRINLSTFAESERFELIYAGTATGLYMLKEMAEFFLILRARRKNAFFRILTASAPELVRQTFDSLGIDKSFYTVEKVAPKDVLNIIKKAQLAISFRKPTFSQIAASPTKNAEYLACGLPVVANDGVGDTTEFIEADETGIVINEFNSKSYHRALNELDKLLENKQVLSERCRTSARRRFDLESVGGTRYRRLYERLLNNK